MIHDKEAIKKDHPIADVLVSLGVALPRQRSSTYAIKCINPEHDDRNPSCVISPNANYFECKSCGARGDIFELMRLVKGMEFKEALEYFDPSPVENEKIEKIDPETYLKYRGINEETAKKFNITVNSDQCSFDIPTGKKIRQFNRKPKYIHSKGSSACLFKAGNKADEVVISEGEFDAMIINQNTGVSAWSGTTGEATFHDEWAQEFEGVKKVYIGYDNDVAGDQGEARVLEVLKDRCFKVRPTFGKDWSEFFQLGATKEDFLELLKTATPLFAQSRAHIAQGDFEAKTPLNALNALNAPAELQWPDPLEEAAYQGIAGKIVKAIEPHTESDPVALLINFLTAFGSIIGSNAHFEVEADKHPARIFSVLVGTSSKGRKGTSWNYIQNIFSTIEPDWTSRITTGLSSGEGLIWAVRDPILKKEAVKEHGKVVRYEEVIEDQGIEDKRLLVLESEFANVLRVLGREGNTLSAVVRNAWDSKLLQTLTKNSQAKSTNSHILIIGHITKEELLRYLTDTETGNGFGNRFLWICVRRSKSLPFGGKISEVDFAPLIDELREVILFAKTVDTITWAQETRPAWEKVYPKISQGRQGLIGSLVSRSEAYVTRLACIYALLDKSAIVKLEHLRAALSVWQYSENSADYIFQNLTGDRLATEILNCLKDKPEGATRTEIYNYFSRHKSSNEILASLELLEKLNKVFQTKTSTAGRAEEKWFLNTDAQKAHNAQEDTQQNSYTHEIDPFMPLDEVAQKGSKVAQKAPEQSKLTDLSVNTETDVQRRADDILN